MHAAVLEEHWKGERSGVDSGRVCCLSKRQRSLVPAQIVDLYGDMVVRTRDPDELAANSLHLRRLRAGGADRKVEVRERHRLGSATAGEYQQRQREDRREEWCGSR